MTRIAALLLAGLLASCADARSGPAPRVDSGITSSNGGGTRALGNQPNVGITTRTGTAP